MSEVSERYQRGKIYCLRSHQTDLVYIGSTVQGLAERVGGHRCHYKKWLKGACSYMTSVEIIKYDDHYIELVENYPCKTKAELERREGQVIRETENCCNRNIVGRTNSEYYQDNKEKVAERHAKYRQENKEKITKQMAKYRQANKEKHAEYNAKYYQSNKKKIAERDAKKVQCECGSEVTKQNLPRHRKTKKHQNYLLTLTQD